MSLDIAAIPHADALIVAINAAGGHAYLADDVKKAGALPIAHTEVYVSATPDANGRVGALGGITSARIVTRVVAQSQRNAENERTKVSAALLGKTIAVGGETFGPIVREIPDDLIGDDDNGFWSGTSAWKYA